MPFSFITYFLMSCEKQNRQIKPNVGILSGIELDGTKNFKLGPWCKDQPASANARIKQQGLSVSCVRHVFFLSHLERLVWLSSSIKVSNSHGWFQILHRNICPSLLLWRNWSSLICSAFSNHDMSVFVFRRRYASRCVIVGTSVRGDAQASDRCSTDCREAHIDRCMTWTHWRETHLISQLRTEQ